MLQCYPETRFIILLLSWVMIAAFLPLAHAQAATPQKGLAWAPPGIDRVPATVNTGVPCSLDDVLQAASKRVRDLVDNMQRFSATEHIQFEEADRKGTLHNAQTAKFTYVAYIHETSPHNIAVEEYRDNSVAPEQFPSKLATTGTAAFALIFHPDYLKDFSSTCEGLTEWNGRPAWRVHLVQTKANNFRGYRLSNRYFRVMLMARAWIDAETFEVLRLETNLRDPIEEIPLKLETVIVEYGTVNFASKKLQFWLPQQADIFMDYRGRRYHHHHSFSAFQLFSVETGATVRVPK